MRNSEIAEIFEDMAFLMELREENAFKVRAFQNGAWAVRDANDDIEILAREKRLNEIKGVGKGLAAAIQEYLSQGKILEFENLKRDFPETLLELKSVPGLGPKKIKSLFQELGIASLSELEYACQENRLVDLKGFGEKTQAKLMGSLAELKSNRGKMLLPQAIALAEDLAASLKNIRGVKSCVETGELRRRLETIARIDILMEVDAKKFDAAALAKTLAAHAVSPQEPAPAIEFSEFLCFHGKHDSNLALHIFAWNGGARISYPALEVALTGNSDFWNSLPKAALATQARDEKEFFQALHLTWIPPEAREGKIAQVEKHSGELLEESDIRGIFHAHTTASDGVNTLEEMAKRCIDLGFEYLGISEHSQSAGYAGGLNADAIQRQREEIDELNSTFKNFKIFQGIESDILKEGALDYPAKILEKLDFVIASLHGQFQMGREEITERVCRALENPFTTWLGHPTGRLLLGRKGADLDMDQVLETAAKHKKSLELNSNPYRLDLDWRYARIAQQKKIPIGVFPDAHSMHGISDIRWGVLMARKAGLTKADIVNAKGLSEMEKWLKK